MLYKWLYVNLTPPKTLRDKKIETGGLGGALFVQAIYVWKDLLFVRTIH